ncbi:DNA-directed RNA polymerase subunit P [Candidatus Bathyarchaeota archaeon]|nr:MAG: DNA-directed RNA polymerase subunit P [Candidatus Bathyarchaeota archaeon]
MIYKCVRCQKLINVDQLSLMIETKCPNCGYRVLRKTRPPIVKKLKAR